MKVYIAGKITGDPNYKIKFKEVEDNLKMQGFKVMSPAVLPENFEHSDYMHICKAMIDICDTVYFLKDWRESIGATKEMEYTKAIGKEVKILGESNS